MRSIYPILLLLTSCLNPPQIVSPQQFGHWYEKNKEKLAVKKEINDMTYSVQYVPYEYLVIKNLNKTNSLSADSVIARIGTVKEQYFTMRIGLVNSSKYLLYYNLGSNSTYDQRVYYYSFSVKNDLMLVEGKDTLRCIDSHFERTFGLTPYITLDLIFPIRPSAQRNENIQFIFNDIVFNNGRIKLIIPKEELRKIPKLNNNNITKPCLER